MKKILYAITFVLLSCLALWAVTVKNNTSQRLIINLSKGKSVSIPARGTVVISDKDLKTAHVQSLIQRGLLVIIRDNAPEKSPKKNEKSKQK